MNTPETLGYPLELSGAQMRDLVNDVVARLMPIIDQVESTPVDLSADISSATLNAIRQELPRDGDSLESVLSQLLNDAMRPSLSAISPGFMGYVPGGGIFYSAVADLISSTVNRFVGAAPVAPGLSEIEASVLRWFVEITGLPDTARGFMTSGGSLANQAAVTIARTVNCGESFQDATVYLSDQAHTCLSKAARLSGIPSSNIRIIETGSDYRLSLDKLKAAVERDREKELRPTFVAASAGTTNTGSIDPLEAIADYCHSENLWFHVDAAYGGFFRLTQRGRSRLKGLEKADSIALDPHKTLFLPYGTGALLVRDGAWLRQTYQAEADYLPDVTIDDEIMDFRDISPELTRPFRGLRVWLPLKIPGADVFSAYLDEKLDLADYLYEQLKANPALEILAAPELSILAFAVVSKPDETLDSQNLRSKQLLERVNQKNRVHLSGTVLNGQYALRVAIGVYRTHQSHIDLLLAELQAALEELEEEI